MLVCSAAPTGDDVFLALFADQVGNYKHINARQSNTCQENRWPIPLSNLDLWSPALSIKHRSSPLGKTLSSVQHSMFDDHCRFTMDMDLGGLRELVMDREAWRAAVHGVAKNRT